MARDSNATFGGFYSYGTSAPPAVCIQKLKPWEVPSQQLGQLTLFEMIIFHRKFALGKSYNRRHNNFITAHLVQ